MARVGRRERGVARFLQGMGRKKIAYGRELWRRAARRAGRSPASSHQSRRRSGGTARLAHRPASSPRRSESHGHAGGRRCGAADGHEKGGVPASPSARRRRRRAEAGGDEARAGHAALRSRPLAAARVRAAAHRSHAVAALSESSTRRRPWVWPRCPAGCSQIAQAWPSPKRRPAQSAIRGAAPACSRTTTQSAALPRRPAARGRPRRHRRGARRRRPFNRRRVARFMISAPPSRRTARWNSPAKVEAGKNPWR